ncbi:MAG: YdcF family protein [Hyphomicrobiales bacterium]|nr:YdcF family protein [Hyphomicrobiales bacterium]MCP5370882.1 YdcF family protein [Hyphomicrobiales bacterium]
MADPADRTTDPSHDAIVVLGAAVLADGRPSQALARRVRGGAAHFHAGAAPWLVLSGGAVGHATPEAVVMADLARGLGVPAAALVLEDRSRNTYENALNTRAIAAARGWRRLLVVTDSFHLPRALYIFRKIGMEAQGRAVAGRGGEGRGPWLAAALREGPAFVKSAVLFRLRPTPPL